MRRTLFAIAVFLVLFAVASLCEAGNVETKKSKGITLSGEIKLDSIFSNREVNTTIYGRTVPANKRQSSSTFFDPTISLNLDIWLAKHVNAYLGLKTPEYLTDDIGSPPNALVDIGPPVTTVNYPSRMLEVDQAYVHIDEFCFKELSVRLGIQEIVYDLLGNGNPFFLALGRSEDAFDNNFQTPGNGVLELNGPGQAGTVEAGGIRLCYSKKTKRLQFKGEAIFATTVETRQFDLDRDLFALVGTITIPHEKDCVAKIMMTLAGMSHNPASRIWTYGMGSLVKATKSLEIFAEAYGQTGTYWDNFDPAVDNPPGPALSNETESLIQQSFGGFGGFKYTGLKSAWKPFIGAEWWWLSGDPDRTDRKQQNFISYEDVDDTIILEENNYGYDLDTNYSALKFRAGFKPGKDWELSMLYGNFRTGRAVKRGAFPGYEKIGDELDIQLKWDYTEDITFRAGAGFLWNGKYFKPVLGNAKTHELIFFEAVLRF